MPTLKHPIYNIRFGSICLSSLFFSSSYNMLIPELPAYLSKLGGAEYIGLIIALFTLTAGLSRPFSGKLTDTIGRKPVIIIGVIVCIICGFLYPILSTVSGFLLLRLFHGFSTGFSPTAISAYVSDIIPSKRWGEALGIQGLFFSTGLALGPAIGSFIKLHYTFDVLFYSSSFMAFMAVVLVFNIKETLINKQEFKLSNLKISKKDILAKEALSPALITFLAYSSFGIILTLIPDWSEHLGIGNKGLFFIVFTIASLCIRFLAGKFSDRYSRIPILILGLTLLFISLIVMGYFKTISGLLIGSIIYGLAIGVLSPTLNAWTVDLSFPEYRGRAIATMYIALEAGIGLGALFSGLFYQGNVIRVPIILYACSIAVLIAITYLLFKLKTK